MNNLKVKTIETNAVDRLYEISKLIDKQDILLISSFDRFNARTKTVKELFEDLYNQIISGKNYENVWNEIKNRFDKTLKLARVNFSLQDFYAEIETSFKNPDRNFLISRADYLTTLVISKIFNYDFLDAKKIIKFKQDELNTRKSASLIKRMVSKNLCIPNNYGVDEKKNVVLVPDNLISSLIASTLKADKLEILTSNNGIGTSNKEHSLRRLDNLSYNSAKTLYKENGQSLISDKGINMLEKANIPLFVKNIYLPENQTIVSKIESEKDISCISGNEFCYNFNFPFIERLSFSQLEMLVELMQNFNLKFVTKNKTNSYVFSSKEKDNINFDEIKRQLELLFRTKIFIDNVSQINVITDNDFTFVKNRVLNIMQNENIELLDVKILSKKISFIVNQKDFDKAMTVLEIYAVKNSYDFI